MYKEPCWGKVPEMGCWALKQKAEVIWSDCRCLEGHILQKVHILPRAALALEILALRTKTFPFLISMGRRDLSPSRSDLAWIPILPHLALTQTSMMENLVALPQGFPEMSPHHPSLPCPHPQPTKEYSSLPISDPMIHYSNSETTRLLLTLYLVR